jgi:hypothetical protein
MPEYISRLSIPVSVSNVIDPISVRADFVYNFYVPNEDREYSPNKRSPIDYNAGLVSQQTVQSIESKSRGDMAARVPRYIKLSIVPKSGDTDWDSLPLLTTVIESKIINNDGSAKIQNINLEGAIQSRYVANPALVDSNIKNRVQREIYGVSEAILKNGGIFGDMSDEMIAKELNISLSDDVDESIILDALSDNDIKGFKFNNEISGERYSRIKTRSEIQYRTNFNANSYREVLSPICVGNPFSSNFETDSLGSSAADAGLSSNALLDARSFPSFSETDPEENKLPRLVHLTANSFEVNLSQFEINCRSYPKINHIGYIVEKYSSSPAGKYETHSSQVLIGRLSTEFIDPNVKYGYTYFYRVRQLYLSSIIQVTNIDTESSKVRYQEFTCAIASSSPPAARVVARETDIPKAPSIVIPEYIHSNQSLRIEWAHPSNPSRDIKKYQIFRRKTLKEPFELITEYDFRDEGYTAFDQTETIDPVLVKRVSRPISYHIDKEFDSNSSFIYCIASVDAHGLCSNYGTQIQVKFNRYKNNIETRIVSRSGAPKAYPNYYVDPTELEEFGSDRLVEDVIKDSGHGTMRLYFNPDAYKIQSDDEAVSEIDRIVLSQERGTYKMQIINIDRQISRTLEAKIEIDPSLSSLL